ncbi:MAG: hypothetical protein M1828_006554 [Chrysothrix sp. TS-e1954]|nr:MAG: hypothetical protein M1828_006554 [Chrysothrix sp. TS-e1954]
MSPHEKLARAFMSAGGSATLSGSPTVGADSRRRALGEKDPNVRLSPPKTLKTRRTSDATVDLETAAPTFGLEDIKVSKDRKNLQGLASQPAPACVPSFELEPTPRAVKQPRALTHASNQQHDGVKRKIDVGEDTDDERPVLKRLRVDIDGRQQLMAGKNDLRSDATQPEVSPHSTQEISARASDEVKGSKICVSSDPEALGPLQDETMSQSSNAPTSSSGKSVRSPHFTWNLATG